MTSPLPRVTGAAGQVIEAQPVTIFDRTSGPAARSRSEIITLSATLTLPSSVSAYAAGDALGEANNVLFEFNFAAQGLPAGIILGARLIRQETTNTAARFRAFVHDGVPPTLPAGDNAPHPLLWANRASRRGVIDFASPITTDAASGDACLDYEGVELSTRPIRFAGDGIVRVVLTTRDAFTPVASRGYTIQLDAGA